MPKTRHNTNATEKTPPDEQAGPTVKAIHDDESGATMFEYALLFGAIALPSYWLIRTALAVLVGHYQMITTINGLPFP